MRSPLFKEAIMNYGFTKISRDVNRAIPHPRTPTPLANLTIPTTPLAETVLKYVTSRLPEKVLKHSLRVFFYSCAIIEDQFPEWELEPEAVFVTSLLHDIGTTDENMGATKMSFEFYGGIVSRDLILDQTNDRDYADAVAEAIIRHQDLGESGYITTLGLIIQISTILDNVGKNDHLIHKDTLKAVNEKYTRDGWLECFAGAIDNENMRKPWGHTSALGVKEFRDGVLGNELEY